MVHIMNILNIVSSTTPPATPPRSRTSSAAQMPTLYEKGGERNVGGSSLDAGSLSKKLGGMGREYFKQESDDSATSAETTADEKNPLLGGKANESASPKSARQMRLWQIPKRIADAILYGATVVFSTITAPGRYVIACFYDDEGRFSAILPLKSFRSLLSRRRRKSTAQAVGLNNAPEINVSDEKHTAQRKTSKQRSPSVDSNASTGSAMTSDGETETEKTDDSPARHTRSKTGTSQPSDDIAPHRKSGRVKLQHNDEALRKRKAQRAAQKKQQAANPDDVAAVASTLKSPSSSSATSKLTRYPRAPAPPRPLVPRRNPSYALSYSSDTPKKTLIIDLDETLIHSMAKGGRMSTGHMVEVRLGGAVNSAGVSLGPGVPILYYVHERPGCHEFLRKVAKWYNLIVFTASVQEYADPVINWLERERKYFSGRYYRQHCTLRNGAYIKDLAQVEPDLSRVMILDNSPMSYIFHEGESCPD